MPEASRPKESAEKSKRFYPAHPWQCRHRKTRSEIIAYVEGHWETVADIRTTPYVSAEHMAQFLCGLVKDDQNNKALLREAREALELCLEEGDLTFSSEQAADKIVTRLKTRGV